MPLLPFLNIIVSNELSDIRALRGHIMIPLWENIYDVACGLANENYSHTNIKLQHTTETARFRFMATDKSLLSTRPRTGPKAKAKD
jgi:hypothetical protein